MSTKIDDDKYLVKLLDRFPVAERTTAFRFEKPNGFTFRPGQWIDIELLDPEETDKEGNIRGFSVCNSPHDDYLQVTTRMRNTAYKRVLGRVPIETEVKLIGPGGSLRMHNNEKRAALFFIGGIGITPVRSILLEAEEEHKPHRMLLFYANRRPIDAPYLDELKALEDHLPNYTFIPTMTGSDLPSSWTGERGHFDAKMIERYAQNLESPIYYVIGPPRMVKGVSKLLGEIGVDEDDLRLEDFSGY